MKNPTRSTRSQRGVTLVEACTVLAVLAVLVSTAAPNLQGLIDSRRLDGAATQLATDIQFVRTEAVARNLPVRLSFHATAEGSCYVLHTGNADQCDCSAPGPATCSGDARQIKTVALTAADRVSLQTNTTSVLFDPLHGTSTPTGTLRLVGQQGRAVHHVINVMGRVRSCSPLGAMPGYRAC
ncbi:MAG: GspH/FimT family pseudopilin [Burkholderiales bacterium]|nr:GspH/FimT family pseudopilin [Burkholderiales bacterium]